MKDIGDSGSKLYELDSKVKGAEKDTGRSNFKRATTETGKRVEQSTQDFFQ